MNRGIFNSIIQDSEPDMKIPTLINSSSKINGELIFTTDVRIDGEVFGKVESDKSVIIGAEGYVKGFLRANDLVVFGRFEGNIIVSGLTILHESASVFGTLYTKALEVKDGATITARVVMYDKLEAIDEAQIYLAEEMIKAEPARRQVLTASHVKISFDDALDSTKADGLKIVSDLKDYPTPEPVSNDSGDVLSKIRENNGRAEDMIIYKQKADLFDIAEKVNATSPSESPVEILQSEDDFSKEKLFEDEAYEAVNQDDPLQLTSIEAAAKPIFSDTVTEIEETDSLCPVPFDEDETFILLTSMDEPGEEPQSGKSTESSVPEIVTISEVDQGQTLEFDFEDSYVDNGELVLFPLPNPISIAGCLGEPVMDDSSMFRKGKKKPIRSENTIITQTSRKNKGGRGISGFEELRNLLIPVKYQQMKLAEKKNDQEKINAKKIKDNENEGTRSKESEKNELFLNNAIRHLPDDDYSSLFN